MKSKDEIINRLSKQKKLQESLLKEQDIIVNMEEYDRAKEYGRMIFEISCKIKELEWVLNK